MRGQPDPDSEIAAIVARQHGVITRKQLLAAGLGVKAVDYRLQSGRLIALARGVYAPGHRELRREGHWMAAVLACGEGAALSHWHAAAARGWASVGDQRIHVTVSRRCGASARRATVRLHRSTTFIDDDREELHGLPITSPPRTLLDLAPLVSPRRLERLVLAAQEAGHFDLQPTIALLDRFPARAGAPRLRRLLDDLHGRGPADTRSGREAEFLLFCDEFGLPTPKVNTEIEGILVDFAWPGTDLTVEFDSFRWHRGRSPFERDRERDQILALAGYRVFRVTDRQLASVPSTVAGRLRRLLASGSRAG